MAKKNFFFPTELTNFFLSNKTRFLFFVKTSCDILPKVWCICCLGRVIDLINLSRDWKIATRSFFQKKIIIIYWKLTKSNGEQYVKHVETCEYTHKNSSRWFRKGNKICLDLSKWLACLISLVKNKYKKIYTKHFQQF